MSVTMTRQHFVFIAKIISNFEGEEQVNLALLFAGELASTNPNFDRNRFIEACGVESAD